MRKIELTDAEKKKVIKLREAGKNWSEIAEQVDRPRHVCKRFYLEWQRESLASEKKAVRRSLVEAYLREHIEMQVDMAVQLLELLSISRQWVPRADSDEHLSPLWNTSRWRKDTAEGIQPVSYPRKERGEVSPRLRLVRGENQRIFTCLKEHTRGQVRWQALDEWRAGWDSCLDAIGGLRGWMRSRLDEGKGEHVAGGPIWRSIGEQVKGQLGEEILKVAWSCLVGAHFGRTLSDADDIGDKDFAGYLTGGLSGEAVIPGEYLDMVKSIGPDMAEILVKDLSGADNIRRLDGGVKQMSSAYRELEEKLNPVVLRPLLLATRCRLCPA